MSFKGLFQTKLFYDSATGQDETGCPDQSKFIGWRGSGRGLGYQLEAFCFPMGLKRPARRLLCLEPRGLDLPSWVIARRPGMD